MTGSYSSPIAPEHGLPLALPAAWSNDNPSAQVRAVSGSSRAVVSIDLVASGGCPAAGPA